MQSGFTWSHAFSGKLKHFVTQSHSLSDLKVESSGWVCLQTWLWCTHICIYVAYRWVCAWFTPGSDVHSFLTPILCTELAQNSYIYKYPYRCPSKAKKSRVDLQEGTDSPASLGSEFSHASCQSSSSWYYSDSSAGLGPSESPDSEYIIWHWWWVGVSQTGGIIESIHKAAHPQ